MEPTGIEPVTSCFAIPLGRARVNINAATFHYFQQPDGSELLARVFLLEPSEVELKTRTKGSSKRRPNLSYEELHALAVQAGVADLYEYVVRALEAVLQKQTTRSSIRFVGSFDGSRKVVISLLPGDSKADQGQRYQIYKNRFAELAKLPSAGVESLMPAQHDPWSYVGNTDPDWQGFQGFITAREEIDPVADALSQAAGPELTGP